MLTPVRRIAPLRRCTKQRNGWRSKCGCKVGQTGIDSNHQRRLPQERSHVGQRHARSNARARTVARNAARIVFLGGAAMRHDDIDIVGQAAHQLAKVLQRPALLGARGAVQQDDIALSAQPRKVFIGDRKVKMRRPHDAIAKRTRRKRSQPLDRMLMPGNRDAPVIEEACKRLTGREQGRPDANAILGQARIAREQRALHKALGIEHRVISLFAQERKKLLPLCLGTLTFFATPAALRNGDDAGQSGMHSKQIGVGLLDQPVNADFWTRRGQIGQDRQIVDDIAQRTGLDDKKPKLRRRNDGQGSSRTILVYACRTSILNDGMAKRPFSAVLITFNAADQLDSCLASLAFADEIVVVDANSSDATVAIAHRFHARVIASAWRGFGAQKRFAVDAASHDWVLCVDADERVSEDLRVAIEATLTDPRFSAYEMPRSNFFMGSYLRHGEGFPDWSLRLFDRRYAAWSDDAVHEKVISSAAVGRISSRDGLLHHSADILSVYLDKQNRYTSLQAEALYRAGKTPSHLRMLFSPALRFIKFYLLRLGFLDGIPGLVHISIGCFNSFIKYAKLFALHREHS